MGWSCGDGAAEVLAGFRRGCAASTGFANEFEHNGMRYFFEIDDIEHEDGRVTAQVYEKQADGRAIDVSFFHLGPDGDILARGAIIPLAA